MGSFRSNNDNFKLCLVGPVTGSETSDAARFGPISLEGFLEAAAIPASVRGAKARLRAPLSSVRPIRGFPAAL